MMKYNSLESIPFLIRSFFKPVVSKNPVMVDVEDLDDDGNIIIVPTHKTETKTISGKEVEVKLYRMDTTYVEKERVNLKSSNALAATLLTGNHKAIYEAKGKHAEYKQWKFFDKYVEWLKEEPNESNVQSYNAWVKRRPYNTAKTVKEVQDSYLDSILELRLAELKGLRNKAAATGFIYGGHTIIADRDAQNDLANIYNQYLVGIKDPNVQTYYKTGPNKYLVLMGGADTLELLKAVSKFIEVDCFGTEARVTQELYAMGKLDLLTVKLSELFLVDNTTDRKPEVVVEDTTKEPVVNDEPTE